MSGQYLLKTTIRYFTHPNKVRPKIQNMRNLLNFLSLLLIKYHFSVMLQFPLEI